MNSNELEVNAIADEILGYLKEHPDSMDSIDGIVQWWLIRQRYLSGLNKVQNALDLLVKKKLVTEYSGANGKKLYKMKATIHFPL